jgi:hypothetical protein
MSEQHEYRAEAEAALDPNAREGLVGGGHMQLVTLKLHHSGQRVDETGTARRRSVVRCDLRPAEARLLAHTLLVCANRAELLRCEPDPAARAAAAEDRAARWRS